MDLSQFAGTSVDHVLGHILNRGWTPYNWGRNAKTYLSPEDDLVLRVSEDDPLTPDYLDAIKEVDNSWIPQMYGHQRLEKSGVVSLTERLYEVPNAHTTQLTRAIYGLDEFDKSWGPWLHETIVPSELKPYLDKSGLLSEQQRSDYLSLLQIISDVGHAHAQYFSGHRITDLKHSHFLLTHPEGGVEDLRIIDPIFYIGSQAFQDFEFESPLTFYERLGVLWTEREQKAKEKYT